MKCMPGILQKLSNYFPPQASLSCTGAQASPVSLV